MTMQFWTAVSPHRENFHQSYVRNLRSQLRHTKKSPGVDNIPAELVQAGKKTMIKVLKEICNRIWRTEECSTHGLSRLLLHSLKSLNLQFCQNYRPISLISHSSKVMLKVILNRLKPQVEEIIAEGQVGYRARKSTTDEIGNL